MNKEDLYHPTILERNKNPLYFGLSENGLLIEAYNPVCGDEFSIRLPLIEGRIAAPSFHGYGCAISKASIDMLLEQLDETKVMDSIQKIRDYLALIEIESPPDSNPLSIFHRVKYHPARLECATLGAISLLSTLEKYKD